MNIVNLIHRAIDAILFILARRTIGARALVVKDNEVLLVKHTYVDGWYSVGGGVDRGESPLEAIKRELREEVGVELKSEPKLFGVYYHIFRKRDDYVVIYICTDFVESDYKQDSEIKEKRWFRFDQLPDDISPSTKMRIEEYLNLRPISDKYR